MSSHDYIPKRDADFSLWATAFSANLNMSSGRYFIEAAEAEEVAASVQRFEEAYGIALNVDSRTTITTAAKDEARRACESLCRKIAMRIKKDERVSDADKINAGVPCVNIDRERIDPPSTVPLLNIMGNRPGVMHLRYADLNTPDSGAKPYGAKCLELYLGIGDDLLPLGACRLHSRITRNPIEIEFDDRDDRRKATYYARWAGSRGETGPWSLPVTFTIAA